jgi:hypothetical protein
MARARHAIKATGELVFQVEGHQRRSGIGRLVGETRLAGVVLGSKTREKIPEYSQVAP